MKTKLLSLLALTFLLHACSSEPKPENGSGPSETVEKPDSSQTANQDTIAYRSLTLVEKAANCPEEKDEDFYCTQASATYIEITKAASEIVRQRIQQALQQNLLMSDTIISIQEALKGFVEEYNAFAEEMKGEEEDLPPGWSLELSQVVAMNTPNIFVVENNSYSYTGGAHGGYSSGYLNFSPRTGKLLTLKDLIAPDKMEGFKKLAEQYFRKKHPEDDYWFPEEGFYLPETFGLLPDGITFVYGLYEIAPYAAGEIIFSIPYDKAKVFAKPYSALEKM